MSLTTLRNTLAEAVEEIDQLIGRVHPLTAKLQDFIDVHCYAVDGHKVLFSDFFAAFTRSLPDGEHYSAIAVSRALPDRHSSAKGSDNKSFVTNVSFEQAEAKPFVFVKTGTRLRKAF